MSKKCDSKHTIVSEVTLKGDAELHRFNNGGNVPYSAIYVAEEEIWSCPRSQEEQMIKDWNES